MNAVCPSGHVSQYVDRCAICGVPIPADPADKTRVVDAGELYGETVAVNGPRRSGQPITAPETTVLSTSSVDQTIAMDSPALEGTGQWVAEISVDPSWYQGQQTTHQLPVVTAPIIVVLDQGPLLIGRRSHRQAIAPDLDCSSDPGVSRQHAQLITDGARWFVEDLGSSNGTFVATVGAHLPDDPIEPSTPVEVTASSRIFVGAWTRIVVRPARPAELS